MTHAEFRALCLAQPGSHEEPHFDRASFRANKKIFATLRPDHDEAMVKIPEAERVGELLMQSGESGPFFSYGGWTTNGGAVGVRLSRVDDGVIEELVALAWGGVVAKKRRTPSRAKPG